MKKRFRQNVAYIGMIAVVLVGTIFFMMSFSGGHSIGESSITTTNANNVTFSYQNLDTEYISAEAWPPMISVADAAFSCPPPGVGAMPQASVEEKTINGRTYCVIETSEGAAGSVYTSYMYSTLQALGGSKIITADFTLRSVQCANYDGSKRNECEEEQASFDVDALIDRIIDTI